MDNDDDDDDDYAYAGLDIGYVPAGPDAFFRWSGQFGPQQLIFYWPAGPVDFIFEKCYEGGSWII